MFEADWGIIVTTAVAKKTSKLVKNFSYLPPATRNAIVEMMRSGGSIERSTLSSIANIMSIREGLRVRFVNEMVGEGSHTKLESGERVILLKESLRHGKKYRADVLFHEIYHDMVAKGEFKELTEAVVSSTSAAFRRNIADRYTKHFNKISISEWLAKNNLKYTEAYFNAYFKEYKGISRADVMEEIAASCMGKVMGTSGFIKQYGGNVNFVQRAFYGLRNIARSLANRAVQIGGDDSDGFTLAFRDVMEYKRLYEVALLSTSADFSASELEAFKKKLEERDEADKEATGTAARKLSLGDSKNRATKIAADMTDSERTRILQSKKIVAPIYEGQADKAINREKENLEHYKIGVVKATLEKIAGEFGIIGKEIRIDDVDVKITLSKSNIGESLSKEASPTQMAKLLPILKDVAEASVGIEVHDNRYYYDTDTVYFENLLGGFIDGDNFVPIRFGLKHSVTGKATLYVVVDQDTISTKKIGEIKMTEVLTTPGTKESSPTAARSVTYSISQVVPFVNSKDVLRYFPDNMLSEEQKEIKWDGIAETIEKTNNKNDKKYTDMISNGNLRAAEQMIKAAAKTNGYTVRAFHGTNAEFTEFSLSKIGTATDDGVYGRGFYFSTHQRQSAQYGATREFYLKIEKPLKLSDYTSIEALAEELEMSESNFTWSGGVIKPLYSRVSQFTSHVIDKGYDAVIVDYGTTDEIVVFKPDQIKSTEAITYDNDGNIIPISKRFDVTNRDTRYSLPAENGSERVKIPTKDSDGNSSPNGENSVQSTRRSNRSLILEVEDKDIKKINQVIVKAFDEKGYTYFGFRTGRIAEIGEELESSGNYTDDVFSGEMLSGTSSTGIAGLWFDGEVEDERAIQDALEQHKDYMGEMTYLIGGKIAEYGNDPGELIIQNPTVLYIVGKTYEATPSDDDGNVIPLSQRFDVTKRDTRYSLPAGNGSERVEIPTTDSDGNDLSTEQQEFFKDSAIRVIKDGAFPKISPDGKLFPVYHGTRTGEFYEFDKKLIGSSNDAGWFGRGFYFAFTEGEAEYYGKHVLKCYLNIKNPFVFDQEMGSFEGITSGDVNFDFASFVLNMAEKFPDLANKLTVGVAEWSDGDTSEVVKKTFVEVAEEIKQIYKSNRLVLSKFAMAIPVTMSIA